MMNKKGIIYKITNPSGSVYVGQTISFKKRMSRYKHSRCESQPHIYNSINKYGWDNHKVEILEEVHIDNINDREIYWINKLDSFNSGMNMTGGGKCFRGRSEETLEKMRKASLGNKNNIGKQNALGYKHTKEAKKNISEKLKIFYSQNTHHSLGKKLNKQHIKKMSEGKYKKIKQLTLDGTYIRTFKSLKEASEVTKISKSSISTAANKKGRLSSGGYKWEYIKK